MQTLRFLRVTPAGLIGEFVFSLPSGESNFRLNIGWQDQGPPREHAAFCPLVAE